MPRKQQPPAPPPPADIPLDKRLPSHQLIPYDRAAATSTQMVEVIKINEIIGLLYLPPTLNTADREARIVKALDQFNSIKPTDGIEAMLAMQMVATHNAAMECMRRAMVPGQSLAGPNSSLSHAQKLMMLYAQQLAILDKHRGKGQEKITVQHVNVGSGGQAIVGNVAAGKTPQGHTPSLEAPGESIPSPAAAKRVRTTKVRRP